IDTMSKCNSNSAGKKYVIISFSIAFLDYKFNKVLFILFLFFKFYFASPHKIRLSRPSPLYATKGKKRLYLRFKEL
ncbi:MAG: hypothetical protein LBV69_00605, partial [Bacteroidales bacterium]|nr:hypothetical protein [Bacteroidales bacterium]